MGSVILVVAPHPDDAEIGMGGTIHALRAQGVRVVIADLSNGEPTPHGSPEIRAQEAHAASAILGVTERILLDLPNREIFDSVENRKKVASVIRLVRPDILFSPYWEDAHPDHVNASSLVDAARFYAKFEKTDMSGDPWYPRKQLYFLSTHARVRVQPSFIFDISQHLEAKMSAVGAYQSQFVWHAANARRLEEIRAEAVYWGAQIGVSAGEPFVCRENFRISSAESLCQV